MDNFPPLFPYSLVFAIATPSARSIFASASEKKSKASLWILINGAKSYLIDIYIPNMPNSSPVGFLIKRNRDTIKTPLLVYLVLHTIDLNCS